MSHSSPYPTFLTEEEIKTILKQHPGLHYFWNELNHHMIVRRYPTSEDPVYEIQLTWQLGDRLESYAWVWIEALGGRVLQWRPD